MQTTRLSIQQCVRMSTLLVSLLTLLALSNFTACATDPGVQEDGQAAPSPLEAERPAGIHVKASHAEVIEKASAGDSDFAGLYNTFELKATVITSDVRESLLTRQSDYYQWDKAQLATEREKAAQELSSETTVFLSFYTPERKNDNLADSKSIWRVYLDAGGRRYIGQAKRDRRLIAELQSLFPYHTRWNSPYLIKFPVATTAIESQSMKLTVTGPLGSRVLEIKR